MTDEKETTIRRRTKATTTKRRRRAMYLLRIVLFFLVVACVLNLAWRNNNAASLYAPSSNQTVVERLRVSSSNNTYQYQSVIYGHIHMAKTGGTFINGFLANNFERVCGHKGYSYDAYQANERFREKLDKRIKGFSRDRVRWSIVHEIGYEDCDFISNEELHTFWIQFEHFHNISMELHLPCRDPIDHLMSQCNYREISFNCENGSEKKLIESIESCLLFPDRFGYNLTKLENVHVKCYDFRQQFSTYMDYISGKLQPRRLVSEYVQRETNRHREKENECIWKDKGLMQRVEKYLVKNVEYYKFCKECLGSDNDILRVMEGK